MTTSATPPAGWEIFASFQAWTGGINVGETVLSSCSLNFGLGIAYEMVVGQCPAGYVTDAAAVVANGNPSNPGGSGLFPIDSVAASGGATGYTFQYIYALLECTSGCNSCTPTSMYAAK
jgi:hypothetical protein